MADAGSVTRTSPEEEVLTNIARVVKCDRIVYENGHGNQHKESHNQIDTVGPAPMFQLFTCVPKSTPALSPFHPIPASAPATSTAHGCREGMERNGDMRAGDNRDLAARLHILHFLWLDIARSRTCRVGGRLD